MKRLYTFMFMVNKGHRSATGTVVTIVPFGEFSRVVVARLEGKKEATSTPSHGMNEHSHGHE